MNRIVVMGVSGCGKTSLGSKLAQRLGGRFVDGDDLHPPENRAKMAAGQPLDDVDRAPWLGLVGKTLAASDGPVIVACSALRRAYRDTIRRHAGGDVLFLHLDGPRDVIAARMAKRTGHYMPLSLLDSQIATLEPPDPDETHLKLDLTAAEVLLLDRAIRAVKVGET
jgi:gluconokinase